MDQDDLGATATAVSYADEFVDAAVTKLDKVFGAGYAKGNPAALAAYIAACASNLNSFMIAATAVQGPAFGEAFDGFEFPDDDPPPPKPKGKRGR